MEDEYITMEIINDGDNTIFSVHEEVDGRISFRSKIADPVMICTLLTGITQQILENHVSKHIQG